MFFCKCTTIIAGGGTEDVNTKVVAGMIFDKNNNPAPDAIVMLIPSNYNPVCNVSTIVLKDTTDIHGNYCFKLSEPGNYSIQILKTSDKTRALLTNEPVVDDTTVFPPATLSLPGSILVHFPESTFQSTGYVFIPGTTISAQVTHPGQSIQIDSVPSGLIPSLIFIGSDSLAKTIRHSIPVVSSQISTVNLGGWTNTSKIYLNTTARGADISNDVTDFPILLRLNSGNFNFDQAKENGEDIRFTKRNGEPLAYEIELWHKNEKRAAIWVKIDTVYGGNDSQYVIMYWGNTVAISKSNSSLVFDTGSGFLGVWHLGNNVDNVNDASANCFNGTNFGTVSAEGIIGDAKKFSSGSFVKVPGLLKSPNNLTLSAWVNSDTTSNGQDVLWGQEIISIGDHALMRLDNYYGIGTCGWYYRSPVTDTGFSYTRSEKFLSNTGWHMVTYTINAETHFQTLYIDGVAVADTNDVNPISYAGLGSDTYIGIHGNGEKNYNFAGLIDEVRVLKTVQSTDAIKLAFVNQKQIDLLVTFK
jgi:hypothetical protein